MNSSFNLRGEIEWRCVSASANFVFRLQLRDAEAAITRGGQRYARCLKVVSPIGCNSTAVA
jgi:hypothetical protein